MTKTNSPLSIIITTRNRKQDLLRCVDSLLRLTYKKFELIIVDDFSSDGTEKLENKDFKFPKTKIIHAKENLMMVGARNLGARKAKGDWVLFVDDDNVVDRRMIENLLNSALKNKDYGIIGVPIHFLADRKKHFASQKFSFLTGADQTNIGREIKRGLVDSDGAPNIFMVKKEVLEKCDFFDPTLIQTFTDVDFAFAAKKLGYKCGVCQEAITYHNVKVEDNLKPRSMGGVFKQKSYCLIRNRMVVIKRYGNFFQKAIFLIFFSWVWPLTYSLLALRNGRTDLIKPYFHGFKDGLLYCLTGRLTNSLPKFMKS